MRRLLSDIDTELLITLNMMPPFPVDSDGKCAAEPDNNASNFESDSDYAMD